MGKGTLHRRHLIAMGGIATTSLAASIHAGLAKTRTEEKCAAGARGISVVEDLMREHGVLRRAFLVYRECAGRLRINPSNVSAAAIHDTAMLFRAFGEDYHERKLEEAHIFPAVRKAGGEAGSYVDRLIAQHNRGRQVTDYILAATAAGKIGLSDAEPLARAFDAFDVMYANHTAREDTIVFPAWKKALSASSVADMAEQFEQIERAQFGRDGFEDAVGRIARIEQSLGFGDIAQFTSPAPGRH